MNFIPVQSFANYIDAHIILGRLKEEGIHCWLKNEATATIIPIWNNAIGGIELMIDEDQLQEAIDLMKAIEQERRSHLICPKCGSHDVEYINTVRKPINWLSAVVTFILGNYALMPEQRYHCFRCEAEFKELAEARNN